MFGQVGALRKVIRLKGGETRWSHKLEVGVLDNAGKKNRLFLIGSIVTKLPLPL